MYSRDLVQYFCIILKKEKFAQGFYNFDLTSEVVSDSTSPIFLNLFSYDYTGQLNFSASATYGASFTCPSNIASALGNNEINCTIGIGFIFISKSASSMSNSNPDNFLNSHVFRNED